MGRARAATAGDSAQGRDLVAGVAACLTLAAGVGACLTLAAGAAAGLIVAGCGASGPVRAGPAARSPTVAVTGPLAEEIVVTRAPGEAAGERAARAAVEQVVTFYGDALELCYEETLRARVVEGRLTYAWDVGADGAAVRVRLVADAMRHRNPPRPAPGTPLVTCVATQLSRWRFPPPARGRRVTYTFVFRPWWLPASQPRRSPARLVADLPDVAWEYQVGRRLGREPRVGPQLLRESAAATSMPAPPTSHPVRGTVAWAGPVLPRAPCVSVGIVRAQLVASLAPIQRCHDRERREHPGLAGALVLRVSVASDGSVDAGVVRSELGTAGAGLIACTLAVVRRWRFTPTPGCSGVTVLVFPLHFHAQ